ncbi:MAG: sigma 54-dependent Fis family transcriptional regulator [Deltaproteobacteria bacterium]|nr:sigma 54-dependent Fis family transcriptional regulator [Deltaproteobacteria bacterium]
MDGPDRGMELGPQRALVRVGSAPECDVPLTDPTVSRHHCDLTITEGLVRVTDHRSSNGTFVDSARVHDVEVPPGTLLRVGQTTLRLTTSDDRLDVPLSSSESFGALIGKSVKMREVFSVLERVAPTEATVLVEGESGTGKELAAEGIHAASPRADEPFVVFDCGAVARELVESALFGHVKGAFTGAVSEATGVFEEADGGTLFLDEIGELPLDLQPKLLRALEKREVRRVGTSKSRTIDVRIVAATNRSLEAEVNAGRFRGDLYYRLAVVKVALPPLRSRPEDIPFLTQHFLRLLARPGAAPPALSDRVVEVLCSRPWPGNVRELRNAVERALSIAGPEAFAKSQTTAKPEPDEGEVELTLPYHVARDRVLEAFERRYVDAALKRSGGNVSAAAREAGVSRKLIQRASRRHGISPKSEE